MPLCVKLRPLPLLSDHLPIGLVSDTAGTVPALSCQSVEESFASSHTSRLLEIGSDGVDITNEAVVTVDEAYPVAQAIAFMVRDEETVNELA